MLKIWLLEPNFPRCSLIREKLRYKLAQTPLIQVISTLDTLTRCLRIAEATKTPPDIVVISGILPQSYSGLRLGMWPTTAKNATDMLALSPATQGVPVLAFTDQPEAALEVKEITVKTFIKADGDVSYAILADRIKVLTATAQ